MTPSKPTQRKTVITNGRLVLPHALITDRALLLRDGKILGFTAPDQVGVGFERVEAGGLLRLVRRTPACVLMPAK